jgi:hypothetical protein
LTDGGILPVIFHPNILSISPEKVRIVFVLVAKGTKIEIFTMNKIPDHLIGNIIKKTVDSYLPRFFPDQ